VRLVVHGTHDRDGQAEARRAAAIVAERLAPRPVELGFIEFAEPSVNQAVGQLVRRGVRRLTVAPLMLFAAAHVKRDIPRLVAQGIADSGLADAGVAVRYGEPLDCHPAVLEVSVARFAEQSAKYAQSGKPEPTDSPAADKTLLLLVGRGSSDPEAIGRFEEFARQWQKMTPEVDLRVCYLAAARPSFEEAITTAGGGPERRVVVQPHLLFHGRLMDRLKEQVAQCQAKDPAREWVLCRHLGPSERIIDGILERLAGAESLDDPKGSGE
jgi:sirohydrochlorin ferrochelatase